jgi:uncharacterized phage protein gp47/JayE
MATYGINSDGFLLKRLADIKADLETQLELITDPDTGETLQIDFDEDDPWIQSINVLAANNALTWEMLQLVYTQFDPAQAVGAALSGLVQLNALTRKFGKPSTIPISLTGTAGTLIPAGQLISDSQQNVTYKTDQDITLDGAGTGVGTASSVENGAFVSLTGTITTILTPITGWDTVTNTADSTPGNPTETDEELRARRNLSTESPSQSPVEALYGNLRQLEGVDFVRVYVNNTLSVDARGIPAKTVAPVVVGGLDQDIAETLFLRTPVGIDYFGTDSYVITDTQGENYTIKWIRPTAIDIEVQIDVTVTDPNTWPADGADKIKAAIIAYAAGGAPALGVDTGFEDLGFVPGEDVTQSRLYTPVNSVPGHKVTRLELADIPNPVGTADVVIAYNEVAAFDSVNITVNVTIPP